MLSSPIRFRVQGLGFRVCGVGCRVQGLRFRVWGHQELSLAVLYISTELHQLHLVADDFAFLHDGGICEFGPAEDGSRGVVFRI